MSVISDECIPIFGNLIEIQVFLKDGSTTIVGGIVYNDYEVVGIILSEDGIKIKLNPEIAIVIIARSNDTNWQLFLISI